MPIHVVYISPEHMDPTYAIERAGLGPEAEQVLSDSISNLTLKGVFLRRSAYRIHDDSDAAS